MLQLISCYCLHYLHSDCCPHLCYCYHNVFAIVSSGHHKVYIDLVNLQEIPNRTLWVAQIDIHLMKAGMLW